MEIKNDASALDDLQNELETLDEGVEISTDDLTSDDFIRQNTNFNGWKEMLDAAGVENGDDILSEKFSAFIADNTRFANFDKLAAAVAAEHIAKKFGS